MAGPDAARPRGNGQALPPEDDENCGALLYHSVSPDDPGLKESTEQVIMKFIRSTNWCVSFGLVSLIMPVIAIPAFAQYGHPGVTIDPTPLVQAKRPRTPLSRRNPRNRRGRPRPRLKWRSIARRLKRSLNRHPRQILNRNLKRIPGGSPARKSSPRRGRGILRLSSCPPSTR